MRDIMKLGLRLFLFALVASALLAMTNEVTKGPIAEQKLAAKREALSTVLPGYAYEQIEFAQDVSETELDEIFVGKDDAGQIQGYAISASPQGYGGEIPLTMGISTEGYVTQVYVGKLAETAGLGSRVGDDPFKEQFIGIAADPDTLNADVDKISGASVSSGAFLNAAEQILNYSKATLGIEPHAGDREAILAAAAAANPEAQADQTESTQTAEAGSKVYEVTGFAPMKVEIETDGTGKIVSIAVPEHSETPGLGADLIADASVMDALIGQDVADAKIDVRSGVTLTSNAINDALAQAAGSLGGSAAGGKQVYEVTGFAPMKIEIETDEAGKIVSIAVPEHSETPGLGADLIADAAVMDALIGQDVADAKIDVRSGVTLTSNAINNALAQAADSTGTSDEQPEVLGDAYTVRGMNKFTLYIEAEDAKIASISVPEHNETPGLGAVLLTEEALGKLVGANLADAHVDIVSGVTLTSDALNQALEMAAIANGIAKVSIQEPMVETEANPEKASGTLAYQVKGFMPFTVEIETDAGGKILSIAVPEHSETPGLGAALIEDAGVMDALIGQNIAEAQIDVRAGVTLTSNAINDALTQAAEGAKAGAVEEHTAGMKQTYQVEGFEPFAVEIETDAEGKILSIAVPEHNETPGLGAALIEDAGVMDALIGQNIAEAQIDVRAGVTLTSNAINDALTQAAKGGR